MASKKPRKKKKPGKGKKGKKHGAAKKRRKKNKLKYPEARDLKLSHKFAGEIKKNIALELGWGKLVFANTFKKSREVAKLLCDEKRGQTNMAVYSNFPHLVISKAPQEIFLDPSHMYRLYLEKYKPRKGKAPEFNIEKPKGLRDIKAVNAILRARKHVTAKPEFIKEHMNSRTVTLFVAKDKKTGKAIGTITGIDHSILFNDPGNGASFWALAVDPQEPQPGVGEALVRHLINYYKKRGLSYLDLSVMHGNRPATRLYKKMGFRQIVTFTLKHKNPVNEPLFTEPVTRKKFKPQAQVIVDEARRRGIVVEVLDREAAFFELRYGGRKIRCRESLTELTNAVAMSRCQDKELTLRVLGNAGLNIPAQAVAGTKKKNLLFLKKHKKVVVKPANSEGGRGISVDVRKPEEMSAAIETAGRESEKVLLEEYVQGHDIRVLVIGFRAIAAVSRKPPVIKGTGKHSVKELIEKLNRRRMSASGGESSVPFDSETLRLIKSQGFDLDSVLPKGREIQVRKTSNLHTGGTVHRITSKLHQRIAEAAEEAARAIGIPVTGIDFIVPRLTGKEYKIIEANERPDLSIHERKAVETFFDMLFPQTAAEKEK